MVITTALKLQNINKRAFIFCSFTFGLSGKLH